MRERIGDYSHLMPTLRYMDDEMAKEIENSVLERCSPHGDVVHVYIDRRSPFVSSFMYKTCTCTQGTIL